MHRTGHVGIGLLLYAPLGLVLSWLGRPSAVAIGLAGVLLSSTAPDVDEFLPLVAHRGMTHTVFAAVVAGVAYAAAAVSMYGGGAGAAVAGLRAPSLALAAAGGLGFAVGALGVLGHVAGDAFTPMGVAPWRPLSGRRHSLALVPSRHRPANAALLALGSLALVGAVALGGFLGGA